MVKIFFVVAVLLAFAAYAYAAIPSNCKPCTDECNIVCKNLNKDICRFNQCKVPNSPSTDLDDYTLVYKIVPCTMETYQTGIICASEKLPEAHAICGNNIVEVGEQCDNTTAGGCCLTNCTSAASVVPFNPSPVEALYTMTTGYGYTINLADIGLTDVGANYVVLWNFIPVGGATLTNFTHSSINTFIITVPANTFTWTKSWIGTYVIRFETTYCESPKQSLTFTRFLNMNPTSNLCGCIADSSTAFCAKNPLTNSATRCDCSIRTCYRRDTSTNSCPTRCRIGYDTCPDACADVLRPKPVSFTIPAYDCTTSSTGCTGLSALNCDCPAICGDGLIDTGETCDSGALPGSYGSCCTTNCSLPVSASPLSLVIERTTCGASTLPLSSYQLFNGLNASNYAQSWELVNYTATPGVVISVSGGSLTINGVTGEVNATFRTLYCNTTLEYVFATRRILSYGCCGNGIVESGETCDNFAVGSCCRTTCLTGDNSTLFNTNPQFLAFNMSNTQGLSILLSTIGLDSANVNYRPHYQVVSAVASPTTYDMGGIWNISSDGTRLQWSLQFVGTFTITIRSFACNATNLVYTFTRVLSMPSRGSCNCDANFDMPWCRTSTLAPLMNPNCDCSVHTCYRRDFVNAGSASSLACYREACPIGYETCEQACLDLLTPKPRSFVLVGNDCPGFSTCPNTTNLSCNCPAICGDSKIDTGETCDLGANTFLAGSCCTEVCTNTPTNPSAATSSRVLPTCATTIKVFAIGLQVGGPNYVPNYEIVNFTTTVPGLTASVSGNDLNFNMYFDGTITIVFRSVFCLATNQIFYYTRTLTGIGCCGDGIVSSAEFCDVGVTNGATGSCCTTNCQPPNLVSGTVLYPSCIEPKQFYTMEEIGLSSANINTTALTIGREQTWYEGVGEVYRPFYTDKVITSFVSNATGGYMRTNAPIVGGLNITFNYNYCSSPATTLSVWRLFWVPICYCNYCGGSALSARGPRCGPNVDGSITSDNPIYRCDCSKVRCFQTYSSQSISGCTNNCNFDGYSNCSSINGACRDVVSPKPISFSIQKRQTSNATGQTCASSACANDNNGMSGWINCNCADICGDGVLDTPEFCDIGNTSRTPDLCCTTDCLTPSVSSASTFSYTMPTCATSVPLTTIQIVTTGGNFEPVWTYINYTGVAGLSPSISGGNFLFGSAFTGTITVTLGARWCNSPASYVFVTRTITSNCCNNSAINLGEQCDLGSSLNGGVSCCSSTCQFASSAQVCRLSADLCDAPETCTGSSSVCPVDAVRNAGTVCRASVDFCDVTEVCNGISPACPVDAFANSSAVCRPSAGICDVAELCTGLGTACPPDTFVAVNTTCRAAADLCDRPEVCTGTSALCPVDNIYDNTHVCRESTDVCDSPELCTGSSIVCPVNSFYTNTRICRNASDICDLIEYCTGSSAACPANFFVAAGTTCRPSVDVCDLVEVCDGVSASCPVDALASSSAVCRPSTGDCDPEELCTGSNVACPADILAPNGQECRASAGDCDPSEVCTGTDPLCPTDVLRPNGFVCRPVDDVCDVQETCTGSSPTCPVDVFLPSSTQCRASLGSCDPAEFCSGVDSLCPVDLLFNSSTQCRAAAGVCDRPEFCTGLSVSCPADILFNSSTQCRAASGPCDISENCNGVSISCPADAVRPNTFVCAVSNSTCTVNVTCNGIAKTCPSNLKAPGSSCTVDGDLCFADSCDGGGTCLRGSAIIYDDGLYCNGAETCNPSTGAIVLGTAPNCNDDNSCTSDSCSNVLSSCVNNPAPGTTGACGGGLGACTPGTRICDGSSPVANVTCVGAVSPVTEVCFDSIDNDCDGLVDEFCTGQFCNTVADCLNLTLSPCDAVACDGNQCNVSQVAAGTTCDDSLACTTLDTCNSLGICVGTPVVCNDQQECTFDFCTEPFGACVFDGTQYDGADCLNGTCNNQGECVPDHIVCPSSPASSCMRYVFNASEGQCVLIPRSGSCDDGNACTLYDTCTGGVCVGQEKSCDDYIECTLDTCDSNSGLCANTITASHCFIDGRCRLNEEVNSECACAICNVSLSSTAWSFPNSALPCDDGNLCTENDYCDVITETCIGTITNCTQYDSVCTRGKCVEGVCISENINEFNSCDDGNVCTENNVCVGGVCKGDHVSCANISSECVVYTCTDFSGCVPEAVPNYTRCNFDASACLGIFYCMDGACISEGNVSCPASANQCMDNVCDPQSGCVEVPRTGQACDDGNQCTVGDSCNAEGECIPGGIWINCDDQQDCTDDFCTPADGCVHVPLSNCQQCNATEDCSQQTCQQVNCVYGFCRYIASPAGFSCADADVCNGQEVCTGNGVCVSLGPMVCDDSNPCTVDTCDAQLGCIVTPQPLTPCDDDSICTSNDECNAEGICVGTPLSCPNSTTCMEYSCAVIDNDPVCIGTPINVNAYCSSGDKCRHNGLCSAQGMCEEELQECPMPAECIDSYTCNDGNCVPVYSSAGTVCDAANLCVTSECDGAGLCAAVANTVTCTPTDSCHIDTICLPATGECFPIFADDGTNCDDDDACTQNDVCLAGACIGTSSVLCLNNDACHAQGTCNATTGLCEYAPLVDYTPCSNDNACMTDSVCLSGVCTAGEPLICPPSENQCLTPRCDPNQGCLYDFFSGTCNDNNACTVGDTCESGQCVGTTISCNDPEACGLSYCLSHTGCLPLLFDDCKTCTTSIDCPYIPCKTASCNDNNTCEYYPEDSALSGCDDSQFCNGVEYCSAGTCVHRPPPSCDDNNDCTLDSCDYERQQCLHTPSGNVTCTNDDLCALSARCDGKGHCLTVQSIDCTASSGCRDTHGCNPRTGLCEYRTKNDGDECLLGNKCAALSLCNYGVCNVVEEVKCGHSGTCDLSTTCDVSSGNCIAPTTCNRKFCSDYLECTVGDFCQGEVCRSGQFSPCDIAVTDPQCQRVVCSEEDGCVIENVEDASSCDTGVSRGACSGEDVCQHGVCVRQYNAGLLCREAAPGGCDVAEYCQDGHDYCPDNVFVVDDTACPDSLFCYASTCQRGRCLPTTSRDCSLLDSDCTLGVCDEESRACVARNLPENTPCMTGKEGQCTPFSQCQSGACVAYYSNELTPCDDGSLCTIDDHCSGYNGNCISGTSVSCAAFDSPCGVGTCNPSTGDCITVTINDGEACNADSNPCTVNDTCSAGICVPGTPLDCSFLNSSCQYGQCLATGSQSAGCFPIATSRACDADYCADGCTVPHQWWALHNSRCRDASRRFTWPDNLEQQMMCGRNYYFWSQKRARTIWRTLMHEWLAATLNEANGACLPPNVASIIGDVETLLRQCDLELPSTGQEAKLYKSYAIILKSYNSGILGPGECTRAPCAIPLNDANYFACLFQSRDVDEAPAPVDFFSAETCQNGMWDYVSEFCQCFMGWAGLDCTECAASFNEDEVFLCVPMLESDDYLLRSVSIDQLPLYMNDEREEVLQLVRATGKRARYPGDDKLDCACQPVQENALESRDFSIYIAQDDTILYIDTVEQNLQLCEQIFDVTIINANPLCDDITVEIPSNESSSCAPPTDWNYICDCCFEDDEECACPNNDVLCLRNHLVREHQRLELYHLLFIIFVSITGVLLVWLSVLAFRWIRNRRATLRKQKKRQSSISSVFAKNRLIRQRKATR